MNRLPAEWIGVYAVEVWLGVGLIALLGIVLATLWSRQAGWRQVILQSALAGVSLVPILLLGFPSELRFAIAFLWPQELQSMDAGQRSAASSWPRSPSSQEGSDATMARKGSDESIVDESKHPSMRLAPEVLTGEDVATESSMHDPLKESQGESQGQLAEVGVSTAYQVGGNLNAERLLPLALFVWGLGIGMGLLRLARQFGQIKQILASATPYRLSPKLESYLRRRFSSEKLPEIMTSKFVRSPLYFGLYRSVILLNPAMIKRLNEEETRDVMVHEMAHCKRRDGWRVLAEQVLLILFWPQPLVHRLCRGIDRSREELCDNVVLEDRDPIAYGGTLVRVAELISTQRPTFASLGLLFEHSRLRDRVNALVDIRRSRETHAPRTALYLAPGLALLLSTAVCGVTLQRYPLANEEGLGTASSSPVMVDQEGQDRVGDGRTEAFAKLPLTQQHWIRQRLEYWESELNRTENPENRVDHLGASYLIDSWGDVDLDHALALESEYPSEWVRTHLFHRLIDEGRIEELVRLDEKNTSSKARLPFWVQVTSRARKEMNQTLMDQALAQIQAITQAMSSDERAIEIGSAAVSEFLALDTQWEFQQRKAAMVSEGKPFTADQLASRDKLFLAMQKCIERVGALPAKELAGTSFEAAIVAKSMKDFLRLESWQWRQGSANDGTDEALIKDRSDDEEFARIKKRREALDGLADSRVVWLDGELPDLGNETTEAWLERQLFLGNHSLALAYLSQAKGRDNDFSSLLAMVARSYQATDAAKWGKTLEILREYGDHYDYEKQFRKLDLALLGVGKRVLKEVMESDVERYHQYWQKRDWASAMEELQKMARKQPKWTLSMLEVGAGVSEDLGYEQVEAWTSRIEMTTHGVLFEMGAVGQMMDQKEARRSWLDPPTRIIGLPGLFDGC